MKNTVIKLSLILLLGSFGACKNVTPTTGVGHAEENIHVWNGNFDQGLDGWTGDNIGEIRDETHTFWDEGRKFYSQGNFLCGEVNESLTGTLRSSSFVLGGEGYISLLLGGNKNAGFVRVVDETTSETVLKIRNDYFLDNGRSWNMSFTWRQIDSSRLGHTMHLELVDEATGGFGALIVDEICTSLTAEEVVAQFEAQKERVIHETDTSSLGLAELYQGNYVLPYVGETNYVVNPSFENGNMTGWSYIGETNVVESLEASPISNETSYWAEGVPFNKAETWFFNGWNVGSEDLSFGLRSSDFTLGGTGFISWRIAGRNGIVKIVAENGAVIGEFANTAFCSDAFPYVKNGNRQGTMTQIVADCSAYVGIKMHIEVWDSDHNGDWGVVFFDDVQTVYQETPMIADMYQLVNQNGTWGDVTIQDTDVRISAIEGVNTSSIHQFIADFRTKFETSLLCEIARDEEKYQQLLASYNAFSNEEKAFIDSYRVSENTILEVMEYLAFIHQSSVTQELSTNRITNTSASLDYTIVALIVPLLAVLATYFYFAKKKYKKN